MASITGKSGKCSNFGNCSLADARTTVDVPNGQDFVCTECGKPLLLLAAGGIAWSLMSGKKAPEPAPPVAATQPLAPPKAEPSVQPPVTGNCSDADERVGLCRRPAQ